MYQGVTSRGASPRRPKALRGKDLRDFWDSLIIWRI